MQRSTHRAARGLLLAAGVLAASTYSGLPARAESRVQQAQAAVRSDEGRAMVVQGRYRKYLARPAQPAEVTAGVSLLRSGEKGWITLVASITGSPEYFQRTGGTPDGFVNRVFQEVAGRGPHAEELPAFLDFLKGGGSREQVAEVVAGGEEAREVLVQEHYQKLLRRPPSAAETAAGAEQVKTGGIEQILAAVAGSDEYYNSRGGGNQAGWQSAVNEDLLGRAAAPSGPGGIPAAPSGPAPSGPAPGAPPVNGARQQLAMSLLSSPEYLTGVIHGHYRKWLNRQAAAAEVRQWLPFLQQGGSSDQVLLGILTSDEYYDAAGGTTNAYLKRLSQDLLDTRSGSGGKPKRSSPLLDILRGLTDRPRD